MVFLAQRIKNKKTKQKKKQHTQYFTKCKRSDTNKNPFSLFKVTEKKQEKKKSYLKSPLSSIVEK